VKRTLLNLIVSAICSLIAFALTVYVVVAAQLAIFGSKAYDNDAGPEFTLAVSGLFVGGVAAVFVAVRLFSRLRRSPKLSKHAGTPIILGAACTLVLIELLINTRGMESSSAYILLWPALRLTSKLLGTDTYRGADNLTAIAVTSSVLNTVFYATDVFALSEADKIIRSALGRPTPCAK
jgi:H+/Cl- antiporter ClcA